MAYKWIKEAISVKRLADGACIPNDPGNMDWQDFQKWVADGGVPLPADPPPPPIDLSNIDNLERTLKALALVTRDYCNQLKAEVRGLAVLLVQKNLITASEANALLAYDGTGTGDQKTVADLKADFAAKYQSLP